MAMSFDCLWCSPSSGDRCCTGGMSTKGQLQGLEGFEALDLGELYYIGGRSIVERGLRYYRDFAVESLEWDPRLKRMLALVAGRRGLPYEVLLEVREGRLEHECDCAAWGNYGACKHVVAATAAMFLAVQGKSVGEIQMPVDYVQGLRAQLGYAVEPQHSEELELAERKTELLVDDVSRYGSMRFLVRGPTPIDFMHSVGVHMPNSSYGYHAQREFYLGEVGRALPGFLEEAKAHGIEVSLQVDGQRVPMRLAKRSCEVTQVVDVRGSKVLRRLLFTASDGADLHPLHMILSGGLLLTAEGAVHRFDPASLNADDRLIEEYTVEGYNRISCLTGAGSELRIQVEGAAAQAEQVQPEAVELVLDCSIWENAALEPERLDFELQVRVDDVTVSLAHFRERCLSAVVDAYSGSLLSAKRRVLALLDLIRRVLADEDAGERIALERYVADFPELCSNDYRGVVLDILNRLNRFLVDGVATDSVLAVDVDAGRWLAYQLDTRKLMMLLFSMIEPTGRRGLLDLRDGAIAIKRGSSGMDVVQRVVQVAARLGVAVRFNELPVRTEALSISVDTKASGSDIDWFALHPTIRCAERTIQPTEWIRLIQGQLLLEGEDGALIVPQFDDGTEGGLQVLADLLRSKRKAGATSLLDGEQLMASRLEMLDWIALRKYGVHLRLPPQADALFRSLSEFQGLEPFQQPTTVLAELRPYQLEGCAWIDFLYRHRFGACLADDMGLGKTLQAIAFIAKCLDERQSTQSAPVLIVLPTSLVFNWTDEFARFAPSLQVVACLRKSDWSDALTGQVILTTYDRVRLDQRELSLHEFDVVVFDEAHNLKNVAAARTKAAIELKRRFTLCLTGTPVENNASEYYSVLSASVPGIFGSLKSFKESFRTAPERILARAKPFILRRTKQALLTELPAKEEHELFLEMSAVQKEIYTRTVAEVREEIAAAYDDQPEQQAGIVALAAILRLRQVCVSPELLGKQLPEPAPKFVYMGDRLEELQAEGNAALVFSQFIGGLDQMEAIARERGVDYLRMDGRTPVGQRREIVRSFQSGDGPSFFFISLKTGGVGLNLTRANYVFHLDPWWNPAVENQASDRAHRIGQTRSVFVQRLIMQHSIEARMLELKARKAELFRQLVDEPGRRTAKAGLQREDFEYLLNG